jgi:hypothetical protein
MLIRFSAGMPYAVRDFRETFGEREGGIGEAPKIANRTAPDGFLSGASLLGLNQDRL